MDFKFGIVGLPNVGKSTLFNVVTKANVAAANYPFCTIEPNVGSVIVPDPRLDELAKIVKPKRIVPTTMEFFDIAGLVAGAAKGEGLGNKFLSHIREVQAIAHVVRCFEHPDIIHVSDKIDPISDIETINLELTLADLETVDRALIKATKLSKGATKTTPELPDILTLAKQHLDQNKPIRLLPLTPEQTLLLQPYQLLTAKPVLYLANVDEEGFIDNPLLEQVQEYAKTTDNQVLTICAKLEEELIELSAAEKLEYLQSLGLKEDSLHRFIQAGYTLLNLTTYFTAGIQEVRAWTIPRQASAPQAAGCIHTDFAKGFIRAEVIAYEDFIRYRGELGAKEAGKWRLEGKDYKVQDGDVIHFRFKV